jgi:serine/threonine protein kinase
MQAILINPFLSKDIDLLVKKDLTVKEAEAIMKKINEHYSEWMSGKEDIYIKSDKANGLTCAIEYCKKYHPETGSEHHVFVHIRGEVDNRGRRIKKPIGKVRGWVGSGSYGIIRDSILLRSNGNDAQAGMEFVQKKALSKLPDINGSLKKRKLTSIQQTEKDIHDEARILEEFIGSKNIIVGFDSKKGMILRKMNLGSLYHVIENGKISPQDIPNIIKQVLTGLKDIHQKGYAHRDIKDANILAHQSADGSMEVKITDFDTICYLGEREVASGTPCWISPNRLRGFVGDNIEVSAKDDMFSFGVLLYDLINTQYLFMEKEESLIQKILNPRNSSNEEHEINEFADDLQGYIESLPHASDPEHIEYLFKKCLTRSLADRPTAEEALKMLDGIKDWSSIKKPDPVTLFR